jgi:hypothetical protein
MVDGLLFNPSNNPNLPNQPYIDDLFTTDRTHDVFLLTIDDKINALSNKINDLKDWIDFLQKNRNRTEKLDILLNDL